MGNESGKIGEALAVKFLQEKNYKIIETNFKIFEGEIDIIAFDKKENELVFIEVKTRKNDNFGAPEEFVNTSKLRKIKKAVFTYLSKNPHEYFRIDVISIIYKNGDYSINHLENITI